ncbi:MAG: hypothetical protein ABEJ44_04570 [Halanaeroarchaeum sp.]
MLIEPVFEPYRESAGWRLRHAAMDGIVAGGVERIFTSRDTNRGIESVRSVAPGATIDDLSQ